ncbi:hypothetical protein KKA14_06725 [bacterium]|nr:hypothetical protein [bacterium]
MSNEVLNIKTVDDYNTLEKHLAVISEIQAKVLNGRNLADIIWDLETSHSISKKQIPSIVHTLLIEKMRYSCLSFNLSTTLSDWKKIHQTVKDWNQFTTIIAYYHPQLDISLINPSNEEHWARIESLASYELMVIYTKALDSVMRSDEQKILSDLKAVCSGVYDGDSAKYQSMTIEEKKVETETVPELENNMGIATPDPESLPASQTPQEQNKRRVTPKYAVQVTNELFHNGNVEAWRNIIESYEKTNPGSTTLLFHNGQRIKHISALFKWGKVKTGDSIFFSIVGEEIKDVAKLKKYLSHGASHDYKHFIKKDVNVVLNLF